MTAIKQVVVTYKNTVEDLIAWNQYVLRHNIDGIHVRLILLAMMPATFGALSIIFRMISKGYYSFILVMIFLISLSLFTILMYLLLKFIIMRKARYGAKSIAGFLESRTLLFNQDQMLLESQAVNAQWKYSRFYSLLEDKHHIYLLVTKIQALIIPRDLITDDEIEFIRKRIKEANSLIN